MAARMPMPKTAVDEYDGFIFGKHKVWRAGKSLVVDDVAKSEFMKGGAERKLRFGARTLDALHES